MSGSCTRDEFVLPTGMNNFLGHPISPEGDDSSQGDITMLESPDSGYRSPQNYFSHRGGESHVVLVTQDGEKTAKK